MTTFSVPTGSYTISSDYANSGYITGSITIPAGLLADEITISNGGGGYSLGANVSIGSNGAMVTGAGIGGSGGSGTYTINSGAGVLNSGAMSGGAGGSGYEWQWNNEEFVDCLPNMSRINDMCKQYPGLQIAFEKFKTTYNLVKDDYDTPKDKRPLP